MTEHQQKSTIWFAIITLVLTILSIFTSQKLSLTDLTALTKAIEEGSQIIQNQQTPQRQTNTAMVVRVIDGDTIELDSGEKVRYIGIDTPELHHPQKGVECFGQQAFERNKAMVEGKVVKLENDVSETDRYGRLLRYVWIDSTLVNESLVQEGYAVSSSYPPDVSYQAILDAAEKSARENKRGLWSSCPM